MVASIAPLDPMSLSALACRQLALPLDFNHTGNHPTGNSTPVTIPSIAATIFPMPESVPSPPTASPSIPRGQLRGVHHIALNVCDLECSRFFYGTVLGLKELSGDEIPATLIQMVAEGKVANFVTPDGTILDLFATPKLSPPNSNPAVEFTRANHLAFDIDPQQFDLAVAALQHSDVAIASGPVTRPHRSRHLFLRSRWLPARNSLRCDVLVRPPLASIAQPG